MAVAGNVLWNVLVSVLVQAELRYTYRYLVETDNILDSELSTYSWGNTVLSNNGCEAMR